MAAIDHDPSRHVGGCQLRNGPRDTVTIIVWLVSATQNNMPVRITGCGNNGGPAVLVHAEERVRHAGGLDRINSSVNIPVGCVFEADGHGEAGGHLAVRLGFSSACADCSPSNEIGKVLDSDRIQRLRRRWNAHLIKLN